MATTNLIKTLAFTIRFETRLSSYPLYCHPQQMMHLSGTTEVNNINLHHGLLSSALSIKLHTSEAGVAGSSMASGAV
jgi:hypothetical protein